MGDRFQEIEAGALDLSPEERDRLIGRLVKSLEPSVAELPEAVADAWAKEIACRVADADAGRAEWVDSDELLARLEQKIAAAVAARED